MRDFPALDEAAEQRAAETLFFSQSETDDSPGSVARRSYLLLLHGRAHELKEAISRMRAALTSFPWSDIERDICNLLRAVNWRFHNVACLALLSQRPSVTLLRELWLAIARGSWTSPQLAATAALIDPDFEQKAVELIARESTYYKSILSLAALLHPEGELTKFDTNIEANLQEARSIDFDNSVTLALDRFEELKAAASAA